MTFRNLAPQLCRQRAIIEATTENIVEPEKISAYLSTLAEVTNMEIISGPFAYSAHECGYGGWVRQECSCVCILEHAQESRAKARGVLGVLDTCKPFSLEKAVAFTGDFFKTKEIVWKGIEV